MISLHGLHYCCHVTHSSGALCLMAQLTPIGTMSTRSQFCKPEPISVPTTRQTRARPAALPKPIRLLSFSVKMEKPSAKAIGKPAVSNCCASCPSNNACSISCGGAAHSKYKSDLPTPFKLHQQVY